MSNLLTGLLGVVLATNQPVALSNLVVKTTGVSVVVPNPSDPVEQEYQKLLSMDDDARAEIDTWINAEQEFKARGAESPAGTLSLRIRQRLDKVKKAYESFIFKNPKHARVLVAFGSFLMESQDEEGAEAQWDKALKLDPSNPAVWNNLANHYGHRSPVKKAFEYYTKAIELNPQEPVYYQNYATTVYLFRKDAMEHFQFTETQVFDKALDLYRQAIKLAPDDFILASDYAQCFYGTKPPRWEDGLKAWDEALKIARDQIERDGVYIHMARINLNLGQLKEARERLHIVTNEMYLSLKATLTKKLAGLESNGTNRSGSELLKKN
ncbi:MAG: tetratricopeptide repeat protein [Opitutaceae bacterium]|nr:tetratricopeptide repeat protein [Verrucomicrobiales bacterium]